ncbi:GNAT family N-acetyltransferase [Nocardia sp. GCM10030253]|uniref:GNAT family N-acetyltransferase n=1 Tax=Nocardia sp. GCM10030253 TaxID=3273404 RepID=UPI003627C208
MIVHQLDQNEWTVVRAVRLAALIESPPGTFGSTFEVASGWSEQQWRQWTAGRTLFTADIEDGTAVAAVGAMLENSLPVVVSMWVAPNHRGTGLSDQLLHAVIDWAHASGHQELQLWVLQSNRSAESLYRRNGFTRIGNRKQCIDWPEQFEIEMSRALEPETLEPQH